MGAGEGAALGQLCQVGRFQGAVPRAGSYHLGILTPVHPQIVCQNRGRKACDRPVVKKKKKKAEGPVFTEEDFQKFQQEYFGS